jgi:hypothetical protein
LEEKRKTALEVAQKEDAQAYPSGTAAQELIASFSSV